MIMQLATGDSDPGPLTIDRDDPDDYKDNYSGGVSPPPSPPPAASPAPSMAPGHGGSSPGLGGLAGLHHALHGLHNLHNLHNLQNFHNLQQNLQTQMAALAGLQGGLGVPSVSSLLHPHLAAAQQHSAPAAPPPASINPGSNSSSGSNNNAPNVPQMVLTSGHVTQGVQGAQLLVPTSQGIAVQPILTIPLGQAGVGSSSLINPLVPLHHLHQPSPHHQHTDQQPQQQQQQQQPQQQQQQQQHHHHHHHHVGRGGATGQVCDGGDMANDISADPSENKCFPFRLPWRTLSSAASSPLPPSTSSNSSSSSSCSSTAATPHPLLGLAGLPPSLFHHHAHNNNNNNSSNNNNNNNNMNSPDTKPKLPLPLSSPVTDAIGNLSARMGGHYPGPPPPPVSARYSPDFLDNHNQPTISQSTGNLVDGVNLDEIKEFAKAFKIRRLSMGLTQTQVGQALSITEGPAYSQSAICRFEKLDITPKSAQKIKPVLERWMQEAEDRYKNGQHTLTEFMGNEPSKKRKRRTSFTPQALEVLNSHFERNTHPSGAEITALAEQLGYEREVVRIWFCNKRQALKNTVRMMAKTSPNSQPPPPPPPPQHPSLNPPPPHPTLNPSPHPTMN